ncbi:D-alanyl-D-alanine carboxypeptidase [Streptomyces sp. XH2]|uniref:D-alanyl-D-alanine carboxypeptidase family protein n=1 Tax=Streptomyces sp. XH2 TaxID=3412483 RepID=UPI003C7A4A42
MAGESPGKSEQRKSSGETTRGEHDPRLGVFRESSGKPSGKADAADAADAAEGGRKEVPAASAGADAIAKADSGRTAGGDARLKAAVAAWVAGTDGDEPDEAGASASSGASGASAASKDEAENDGDGDRPVNGSPAGKGAGTPSGEGKAPASGDRATAVFGALRTKDAAPADDAEASKAAKGGSSGDGKGSASGEDKPAASGDGEAAKGEPSGDAKGSASGEGKPAAPVDRVTSVFRTVRPKAGEAAGDGEGSEPAAAGRPANGSASGDGKGSASVDRATSVFRTVRPKTDDAAGDGEGSKPAAGRPANGSAPGKDKPAGSADQATAVFRTVRPKDGESAPAPKGAPSGDGKGKPAAPADQATAVFGAIRPKGDAAAKSADKASGKSSTEPSADDQPTALMKAPKVPEPKAAAPKAAAPKAGAPKAGPAKAAPREDSDSERTSQFVPLKSDDAVAGKAAPAKPAAQAKPAAKATPPAAKASAPAKPAIPVSVAPPKEPSPKPEGAAAGAPAAPLDLLAQLTNTPPPPETPVRTVLRRVKIWTPLVILLAIIFCVVQAFRPLPEPKLVLTANKAFKFDGDKAQMTWPTSGQAYVEVDGLGSLGEYGEEKPVPIASVTKVMTAYITLRDHPMKKGDKKGALMTVDAKAVSDYQKGKPEGESLVRVTENQKLSEYEALEALMLPSANNIAKLLARWDAGSEEAFVKKMNDTAKELGMVNTNFTDPSGFDATTKSTAKDLVKLGKKAMADPVFREISGLTEYIDSNGEKQKNFNPIVPLYGTGIKTGTTTAAGGNLLFAAEKKIGGTTQLIIGAVLAQHKTPIIDSVVAATKDAIESAKKALEAKTVVKKGDVVGAVDDGLGGRTPVVATKDVTAVGWSGLTVDLALNDGGHKLPHAAKSGAEVGMLTVGSGPGQVRVPVALKSALAEPGFGSKLTRLG